MPLHYLVMTRKLVYGTPQPMVVVAKEPSCMMPLAHSKNYPCKLQTKKNNRKTYLRWDGGKMPVASNGDSQ
jgi:hypothetical protein